jgi:hypothetical protein
VCVGGSASRCKPACFARCTPACFARCTPACFARCKPACFARCTSWSAQVRLPPVRLHLRESARGRTADGVPVRRCPSSPLVLEPLVRLPQEPLVRRPQEPLVRRPQEGPAQVSVKRSCPSSTLFATEKRQEMRCIDGEVARALLHVDERHVLHHRHGGGAAADIGQGASSEQRQHGHTDDVWADEQVFDLR